MNNILNREDIKIENMIYEVDDKNVMLDSDLAKLYHCKNGTKEINQAVKNNPDKFPERFSWVLSNNELSYLRSKFLTTNISKMARTNPRVFTEQGVAMLATILKTKVATAVSIRIMDAFVTMRNYFNNNEYRLSNIESKIIEHDNDIRLLQESFAKLDKKKKATDIYFDGQIYDAYFKILDIFSKAKSNLIIIDNYADNNILDIVKRLKIDVTLITKQNNLLTKQDIEKYNKQYHNLDVIFNNTFHDRYFILDNSAVYHCGASINRIGYKTFSITLIKDKEVYASLLKRVNNINSV